MTTVNFNQVLQDAKSASFEALPNGDYDVEVEKADSVIAGSGRPMIKATFKVIVGPHTNRKVINNFVLVVDNPTALSIFFRNMKCFGLTEDFFASLGAAGTLDPVAQAMVGRRVRLQLGQREWNGEMRNEVKGVKPYTGAPSALGGATGPSAGPSLTGVPSPGPAAYGATPSPAPAPAPMHTPAPAPTPVATTPQPAPVAPPQADVAETPAPASTPSETPAAPAPPALPI